MSSDAARCLQVPPANVSPDVCPQMSSSQMLPGGSDVPQYFYSLDLHRCPQTFPDTHRCPDTPGVPRCLQAPDVTRCPKMCPDVPRWPHMAQISPDVPKCPQMLTNPKCRRFQNQYVAAQTPQQVFITNLVWRLVLVPRNKKQICNVRAFSVSVPGHMTHGSVPEET